MIICSTHYPSSLPLVPQDLMVMHFYPTMTPTSTSSLFVSLLCFKREGEIIMAIERGPIAVGKLCAFVLQASFTAQRYLKSLVAPMCYRLCGLVVFSAHRTCSLSVSEDVLIYKLSSRDTWEEAYMDYCVISMNLCTWFLNCPPLSVSPLSFSFNLSLQAVETNLASKDSHWVYANEVRPKHTCMHLSEFRPSCQYASFSTLTCSQGMRDLWGLHYAFI